MLNVLYSAFTRGGRGLGVRRTLQPRASNQRTAIQPRLYPAKGAYTSGNPNQAASYTCSWHAVRVRLVQAGSRRTNMRHIDIHKLGDDARFTRLHAIVLAMCTLVIIFDGYDLAVAGIALPSIMKEMGIKA